jgi:hypothetical protein
MTSERFQLFKRPDIEQPDQAISTGGSQEVSISAPFQRVHHRFMCPSAGVELVERNERKRTSEVTHRVERSLPVLGSQNFTNISLLPLATSPFEGCQSTHLTSHPCPLNTLSSCFSPKFQILTLPSSPPVTNFSSVGEKEMERMDSRWARRDSRLFMVGV